MEEGNCYQVSAQAALRLHSMGVEVTLVHGAPTLRIFPFKKYGHAWIEINSTALDLDVGVNMPVDVFYAEGNIDPEFCVRYSGSEVEDVVSDKGHWGPWALKFLTEDLVFFEEVEMVEELVESFLNGNLEYVAMKCARKPILAARIAINLPEDDRDRFCRILERHLGDEHEDEGL